MVSLGTLAQQYGAAYSCTSCLLVLFVSIAASFIRALDAQGVLGGILSILIFVFSLLRLAK